MINDRRWKPIAFNDIQTHAFQGHVQAQLSWGICRGSEMAVRDGAPVASLNLGRRTSQASVLAPEGFQSRRISMDPSIGSAHVTRASLAVALKEPEVHLSTHTAFLHVENCRLWCTCKNNSWQAVLASCAPAVIPSHHPDDVLSRNTHTSSVDCPRGTQQRAVHLNEAFCMKFCCFMAPKCEQAPSEQRMQQLHAKFAP